MTLRLRVTALLAVLAAALAMPARADTTLRIGMLSPEIASFCVNTGGLHDPTLSPYPPEIPGTHLARIQISVSQAPIEVSTGDLDMAECAGASGVIQAWLKGARNVSLIFVGSAKPSYLLIGGKGITTLQDLKGKAIASPGPQSTAAEAVMTILQRGAQLRAGADYTLVSTGTGGARDAALSVGAVAAIPSYPPFSYHLIDQGYKQLAAESDYVPEYVAGSMLVNKTWAAQHAELVVALLKSFVQTGTWMADPKNKDAVIAAFAAKIRVGRDPMGDAEAKRFYADIIAAQRVAFNGYAPPSAYQSVMEIMSQRAGIAKDSYPPLHDIVDYSYLNRALAELGMPKVPPAP